MERLDELRRTPNEVESIAYVKMLEVAALDYNWVSSFRSVTFVDSIDAANAVVFLRTLRSQSNPAPRDREYLLPYG